MTSHHKNKRRISYANAENKTPDGYSKHGENAFIFSDDIQDYMVSSARRHREKQREYDREKAKMKKDDSQFGYVGNKG